MASLTVELGSFGFKYGEESGHLVFDARFLPNPFYVDSLRPMTGKDKDCADYVFSFPAAHKTLHLLKELILTQAQGFMEQDKTRLDVWVGCTGGQHRSVAIIEALSKEIEAAGFPVSVRHRDIERAAL
jgi:UPF0042 nucleotide-binding protein